MYQLQIKQSEQVEVTDSYVGHSLLRSSASYKQCYLKFDFNNRLINKSLDENMILSGTHNNFI